MSFSLGSSASSLTDSSGSSSPAVETLRIGSSIKGIEWTPCGTRLLVFKDGKQELSVYDMSQGKPSFIKTFQTPGVVKKVASSSSEVNTIAVGFKTGSVAFFDGTTFELLADYPAPANGSIKNISWVGRENKVLIYGKDYEKGESSFDLHYPHPSLLRLYSRDTKEDCSYLLDTHVTSLAINSFGSAIAVVKDCINLKEGILAMRSSDSSDSYVLDIYSLEKDTTPTIKTHLAFDNRVTSIAWSPTSDKIAVLFDRGSILVFDLEGHLLREWSSEAIARLTGEIDWSGITGLLAVPTNKNYFITLDLKPSPPTLVDSVGFSENHANWSSFYSSRFLKWSKKLAVLALAKGNMLEDTPMTSLQWLKKETCS